MPLVPVLYIALALPVAPAVRLLGAIALAFVALLAITFLGVKFDLFGAYSGAALLAALFPYTFVWAWREPVRWARLLAWAFSALLAFFGLVLGISEFAELQEAFSVASLAIGIAMAAATLAGLLATRPLRASPLPS